MSWFSKKTEKAPEPVRRLRVAVGPDPDHLVESHVNNPACPTYISSPNFEAKVLVRVKDFSGTQPAGSGATSPANSKYFEKPGRNRRFAITMQCRFKEDWDAGEVFFGGVFDRRISPPFGTSLMLKAASMIDPSLQSDLDVAVPWVLSSLGCAMNAMICRPSPSLASSSDPHAEPSHDGTPHKPPHPGLPRANSNRQLPTYPESVARVLTPEEAYAASPTLGKWTLPPEDSDIDMVEDTRLLFQDSGYDTSPCATDDSKARRRWMKDSDNRHSVVFRKDRVYDMEIYAPFIDLNHHVLNLGLTIDMSKYITGQPITIYLLGHRTPKLQRGQTLNFMKSLGRKSPAHRRGSSVSGPDPKDLPPRKDDVNAARWFDSVKVFAVLEFSLVEDPSATMSRTHSRGGSSGSLNR